MRAAGHHVLPSSSSSLSSGLAGEGAELGYDRLPPLHTTLEPYAPALHFTASITICVVINDIYYGIADYC